MNRQIHERAERLEALIPRTMRSLFRQDPLDPLQELPMAQLRIMRLLFAGTRTPSALGEELGMSMSAVTQVCSRLQAAGYVDRADDPTDRRVKHLLLSEQGKCVMDRRHDHRVAMAIKALEQLTDEQQEHILAAMELLAEAGVKAAGGPTAATLLMVAEEEQRIPPTQVPHGEAGS